MLSLTGFNPWNDLAGLHRDLDAFFGRHFGTTARPSAESVFRPEAEIVKDHDKWLVSVYVPGVAPKSIDVELVGQMLRLTGERTRPSGVEPYMSEVAYGRFEREFALPDEIDPDQVQATYRNGVLELALPVKETAKPRRIEVVTSGTPTKHLNVA